MPEYLSPGVYMEEVSFRSKSIEGVPTSTTGMAGLTRFGPVHFDGGPTASGPRLITSFTEFESVYGGLDELFIDGAFRTNYLAHAARAFFLNGGARLYVSRVFVSAGDPLGGRAERTVPVAATTATWRARWPGKIGNTWVNVKWTRSRNLATVSGGAVDVKNIRPGAVVEIVMPPAVPPADAVAPVLGDLARAVLDPATQKYRFYRKGPAPSGTEVVLVPGVSVKLVELTVEVRTSPEHVSAYGQLATVDDPNQKRYVGRILQADDPEDENALVCLDFDPGVATFQDHIGLDLMVALVNNPNKLLDGGNDGALPSADDLNGEEADPDDATKPATGLTALGEIDDIAIVAMPDAAALDDATERFVAAQYLIAHAEDLKYRIAVVDAPEGSSINEVRAWRGQFDTTYGALYHPWIEILDPLERPAQGAPPRRILLPPSGFVAGIYARTDIERGVHNAPANEIVRGLTRLEANINKRRQDVLNPEGINALRFFPGRGNRVWGARTISSDPEWKYVNVRRLFIFLEHSIDKSTQWAVFEPNNERLWANIRFTIEDFLLPQWKAGALLGSKPEEAYFVRCDRTTMTQNDLDNGRAIVLIGVAPVKPAEFVIFRIGQFTASAQQS